VSEAGEPLITDSKQQVSSFTTYPVIKTLYCSDLADCLAPNSRYLAIVNDRHRCQLPRLVRGLCNYKTYAYENNEKFKKFAKGHAMKTAVIISIVMCLLKSL